MARPRKEQATDTVRVEIVEHVVFDIGTANRVETLEFAPGDVAELAPDLAFVAIGNGRAVPSGKKMT